MDKRQPAQQAVCTAEKGQQKSRLFSRRGGELCDGRRYCEDLWLAHVYAGQLEG